VWSMAVQRPWMWNSGISMTRPVMNHNARNGMIREMKGTFSEWFRKRDLPPMAEKTFHETWEEIKKTH
jgi:hypothetical protein